jgi:glucose-6-phosphate 1-epimerase
VQILLYNNYQNTSKSMIDILNQRYGQSPNIEVVKGENDMPKVVLRGNDSSCVEIYLHGAHVTSFKTKEGKEVLYMSEKAVINKGSKIRGGIPICFPQFAQLGPMVQHGFARQSDEWKIVRTLVDKEKGFVSVLLRLNDTSETRQLWNQNQFQVDYLITLTNRDQLLLDFKVTNQNETDDSEFTCALHSYYQVDHIDRVAIAGLSGLEYQDKVTNSVAKQADELLTIAQEIDRVYYGIGSKRPSEVRIQFGKGNKNSNGVRVELLQEGNNGFRDCVVWNPWIDKAKSMADMNDEDYQKFVCVEPAIVQNPIRLNPSQSWYGRVLIEYCFSK